MKLIYKKIQMEDTKFLYDLFKVIEYRNIFFEHKSSLKSWQERFYHIQDFQIVYDGNEKIGVVNVKEHPFSLDILLIAVRVDVTFKGYGKKIMNDMIKKHNKPLIKVSVKEDNEIAINFYKKLGFIEKSKSFEDQNHFGKQWYINLEKVNG